MPSKVSELIVGIDFGTTYSGVSWAKTGGQRTIRLINNWPDPSGRNTSNDKVPSAISYVNGKPKNWGYTVGTTEESFKWFKILLEEDHKYAATVIPVKDSNTLLKKLNKTAQEVVADYLRFLWEYTIKDIEELNALSIQLFELRVVLTVPAVWSYMAKERTSQAALLAGMPKNTLVTEPEAAALATLNEKATEGQTLKLGDAFVVCDAGGGTVDLISYQVEHLNPLKIRECAIGSGALCGSLFVDLGFQNYIELLIGAKGWNNVKESNRRRMMEEFEYGIKRNFAGRDDQTYSVDLRGVEDNPAFGINDNTIPIKMSALRTLFDHVYCQIEELIGKQVKDVLDRQLSVKAILLVGGFGENKYLYDRLEESHARAKIRVLQVNGAWSSICRGATLWGLEQSDITAAAIHNPTITSRVSRYSYGLCVTQHYNPSKHRDEDHYFDEVEGREMANNQMQWLLERGHTIKEGCRIRTDIRYNVLGGKKDPAWPGEKLRFAVKLYYNDQLTPPLRKEPGVKFLCQLGFQARCQHLVFKQSFKSPANGETYTPAEFQISIVPRSADLEFVISHRKGELARAQVNYAENVSDPEVVGEWVRSA